MTIEEIIGLNLETESIEFKARLEIGKSKDQEDKALRWLKEIVAFSNGKGGTLYVGVNDKSHELEPLSHDEFDHEVQLIYDELRSRVEPEIKIEIQEIPLTGTKPICYLMKLVVPPSTVTPVFVHVNGVPVAFIRKFGRSCAASSEELINLVIKNNRLHYDQLATDTKFDMNDFSSFKSLYEKVNKEGLTEKALISHLLINDEGYFTRGGILFSDHSSSPLSLMKITQYEGISRGNSIIKNATELKGNLFTVIYDGIEYISNHTNSGYIKTESSRMDFTAYPRRSLLEGLVNAYAHRNYFIDGSQISVDIFTDRLEITSPGSLLGSRLLDKEKDFSSIDPKRRNQVICDAFVMLKMMESKGSGLKKISEDYFGKGEEHAPFISTNGETFILTLPDLTYEKGVLSEDNENPEIAYLQDSVVTYDKQILSYCYLSAKSLTDIASFLSLTPSTHLRKDIIGVLVEQGYLIQSKRGYAYYYLTNREKVRLAESNPLMKFKK